MTTETVDSNRQCTHTTKGLCQSCTFEWMRGEIERLTAANAELQAQLILERARSATSAQRVAEVAGEDIGDLPGMVLK